MNMHILNGRCKGDEDGEITFVAAQGKSVIDYVIVETELYSYCEHFQMIDYDSDNRLWFIFTFSNICIYVIYRTNV